jgi:hypothetical protein
VEEESEYCRDGKENQYYHHKNWKMEVDSISKTLNCKQEEPRVPLQVSDLNIESNVKHLSNAKISKSFIVNKEVAPGAQN